MTNREQWQALEIGDEALDAVVGGMTGGSIGSQSPIKPTVGGGGNGTNTPTTGGETFEAPKPSR